MQPHCSIDKKLGTLCPISIWKHSRSDGVIQGRRNQTRRLQKFLINIHLFMKIAFYWQ